VTVPEVEEGSVSCAKDRLSSSAFSRAGMPMPLRPSVLRSSNIPFPHLHLSYPSQVRGLVVRRAKECR
jgi:hypothetical protein